MDKHDLNGLSILVVEDEPIVAIDLAGMVVRAGGTIIGPAYSLDDAFQAIEGQQVDGALLDINLRNERVFTLADALADRGVPIVFVTGEIWPDIPERHAGCRRIGKPITEMKVLAALTDSIFGGKPAAAA